MKKKALVLIDYENLYMIGMKQGLELTEEGIGYFITYLQEIYDIEDGMINIVFRFRDFPPLLPNFLESLSLDTIDAIDEGKDVADGYLIVEGVKNLVENADSIDEVVLVGGDNVYAGLIRNIVKSFRKTVNLISWKSGLASTLEKINPGKVSIQYVEDLFKIETGEEFSNGWFKNDDCTDLEFAVISYIAKSKFSQNYHLNSLANHMVNSPDPRVANFKDYGETRAWYLSQTGHLDLFIKERVPERGIMIRLNPANSKVQFVLKRINVTIQ